MADELATDAADAAPDAASDFAEFSKLKSEGKSAAPDIAAETTETEVVKGNGADTSAGQTTTADKGAAQAAPKDDKVSATQAETPEQLRAALAAAQERITALDHENRSHRGRLSAAAKAPAPEAGDKAKVAAPADDYDPLKDPEFIKFEADLPEVAGPFKAILKNIYARTQAVSGKVADVEKSVSGLNNERDAQFIAEQTTQLTDKHKDWLTVTRTPEFQGWLAEQPEEIQALIVKNADRVVDARAGARALDLYKLERGIGREPVKANGAEKDPAKGNGQGATSPVQDRRTRQLAAAASVATKGPGPASGPAGDDESALFKFYAAEMDKKIAAGLR